MKRNDEWAFFRKLSGQKAYHKKCIRCVHKCKQSWRIKWIECPRFSRADCTKTPENGLAKTSRIKEASSKN